MTTMLSNLEGKTNNNFEQKFSKLSRFLVPISSCDTAQAQSKKGSGVDSDDQIPWSMMLLPKTLWMHGHLTIKTLF